MSFSTHASLLFRFRGCILASFAVLALALASPNAPALWTGALLVIGGCALRFWAFAHLGSQGRTRDPRAPTVRVVSGPYRFVPHPVYLGNLVVALGLLLCASPPALAAVPLLASVVLFYAILGHRESLQLNTVPRACRTARLNFLELARSERSTWIQLSLFLGCALLRM